MVLALAAPFLHWLVTRIGIVVPFALLAFWALRLPFLPIPSSEATTYFTLGAWIATGRRHLFVPVGWLRWTVPLHLALLALDVTLRVNDPEASWLYTSALAVGVVMLLALVPLVERSARLSAGLVALSGTSFFVFAAHEPLMTMLRKLLYRYASASQGVMLVGYALLPLALAAILVVMFFALRRIAPRFTAAISGER